MLGRDASSIVEVHLAGVRPDESDAPTDTVVNVEAFVETQGSYILPKQTDLEMTRAQCFKSFYV